MMTISYLTAIVVPACSVLIGFVFGAEYVRRVAVKAVKRELEKLR